MTKHRRIIGALVAGLASIASIGSLTLAGNSHRQSVNGTIWVANRGDHTIKGFDADTGSVVHTVAMRPGSQPGDLAYAKGKVYVAEEFGTPPAIAIVDAEGGEVVNRIFMDAGSRPHHVHASIGGNLVAVGLFGTDKVAVVDTHDDTLLGPWDSNPDTTDGRVHAAVFSQDGHTLYLASDASNEVIALDPRTGSIFWRMMVPAAHELAVTHNDKYAFVSRRTANKLAVIDLEQQTFTDVLTLGLPDTLRLSANQKLLTIGLRTMPAQLAVVDTQSFKYELVNLSPSGGMTTIAGHQWTSPSGRYTFAAFEGGTSLVWRSSTTEPGTRWFRRSATRGDRTASITVVHSGFATVPLIERT
jgi:DNA-binding beta-propeller fold protein YncE